VAECDFQINGFRELSMNSDTIKDHGATDRLNGQARKPWVTPSLQIIALKSAENGFRRVAADGAGGHPGKGKS
jgi:hypothetical protein